MRMPRQTVPAAVQPQPTVRPGLPVAALLTSLALVWSALSVPAAAAGHAPRTGEAASTAKRPPSGALMDKQRQPFPAAPLAPRGVLTADTQRALADIAPALRERRFPSDAVKRIGGSRDARLGWVLYDLLRSAGRSTIAEVVTAFEQLTGWPLPEEPFTAMGDRLLAWDLPAPPGYRKLKRDLFLLIEPAWEPFFADDASAIDWRLVGWGGVYIDDRLDATQGAMCPHGCIPALDQPKVTPAAQGRWYPDSGIVFGVVINGEARAYPKNMLKCTRW